MARVARDRIHYLAAGPRRPYELLVVIDGLAGDVSWARLRKAARLSEANLQQTLLWLNARGFVAARPIAEGDRRPVKWTMTKLGGEIVLAFRSGMVATLRAQARLVGSDRVDAFRRENPWLFLHDPPED
ncbi:MAG TPA: hypothetical protein VM327_02930 [Candidatus Thermoplasmatota archaeon]|nr:hypothetical protein [Candidatus Thermoplasmatota archaeon]